MIVVDENIHRPRILTAISSWYTGRVLSLVTLRPNSVIYDESVPSLLLTVRQPTFVTINVSDFWLKIEPHRSYCIVGLELPQARAHEVPNLLRRLFRVPLLRTKTLRMGKVVRARSGWIEFYSSDRHVQRLSWAD